jgi:hypothetical protein
VLRQRGCVLGEMGAIALLDHFEIALFFDYCKRFLLLRFVNICLRKSPEGKREKG